MDGNCKGEFLLDGAFVVVVVDVVVAAAALWHHGRKEEAERGRLDESEDMSEDGVGR